MDKNIYLGADHNGWQMKNDLRGWLTAEGYKVTDMGPKELDLTDDYPEYAFKVAQAIKSDPKGGYGILLCGSGVGMAVAAGKVAGIRAALIHDPEIARLARNDDNVNVLSLGANFLDLDKAKSIVKAYLGTDYAAEERYQRRIDMIQQYEQGRDGD
jgi:ribose 5-phosphate isomerase B